MEKSKKRADSLIGDVKKYNPDMTISDLMMINHFEPKALTLLSQGKIDLNYIPGNSKTLNKSLGYYLYGNNWKGVKTGYGS